MMLTRVAVVLTAIACFADAQVPASPRFEVASAKAANGARLSMGGGPGTADPERINYENANLKQLLMKAYGVAIDQIAGPAWIDSGKYTITAKIAPGTSQEKFQLMLQNLLTERFQLTLRHEKKDFTVYELTVAKGGPKLTPAAPPEPNDAGRTELQPGSPIDRTKDKEGCPVAHPGVRSGSGGFGPGITCSRFTKYSLADFAGALGPFVGMQEGSTSFGIGVHVIDKTGIQGEFDFKLKYHLMPRFPGQTVPPGEASDPGGVEGPSLFTALEQQLGLKLEKKKMSLDLIVVDKADRVPTEN